MAAPSERHAELRARPQSRRTPGTRGLPQLLSSSELHEAADALAQATQALAAGVRAAGAIQASCCLVAAAKTVLAAAKLLRPAFSKEEDAVEARLAAIKPVLLDQELVARASGTSHHRAVNVEHE